MGIKTWFRDNIAVLFRDAQEIRIHDDFCRLNLESYYKLLAIQTAINYISSTLSLAEFKTFERGKEIRDKSYYLFNVEPNLNQNANRFWRKVVQKLIEENEALVVMKDKSLYVADSFEREVFAFKECKYKKVEIEGLELNRDFRENEVFYLKLHSTRMSELINGLYDDYEKLIAYSKRNYKRANAPKGVLNIPANYPKTKESMEKLSKLLNENFQNFFNAENGAVLPLTSGITYEDLTSQTYKNSSDSRDIKNLVDDVFDYVAIAFQIPPSMLKGGYTENDDLWENYLTNCVRPLSELIEKEINRKYYGKNEYLKKTYLKVDTSLVKPTYIIKLANALDILTRNGINTLDDNLKMLGREEVGGELGETRMLTLNLTSMEEALKGGERENEQNGE